MPINTAIINQPDSDLFELDSYLEDPAFAAAYEDVAIRTRLRADLVAQRKAMKMTQREVAERMSTTQSFVSEFENGRTDPHLSTLQRYGRAVAARLSVRIELPAHCEWEPRVRWAQVAEQSRYGNRTTTLRHAMNTSADQRVTVERWSRAIERAEIGSVRMTVPA
jgi:transcriptional regulator with XRE-family HTH domain